jgi:hypothetical protein
VEVASPVSRFPANQLLCIASIASFSCTFPARIVNSRAFAGVQEMIFSSSQIPSLPDQHPPSLIPLYQQRHKPVCVSQPVKRIFLDLTIYFYSYHFAGLLEEAKISARFLH